MFSSVVEVDPVEQIADGLRRLQAEDRSGWSGPARTDRAVGLTQVHGQLEALTGQVVGEWAAAGAWELDGSHNATASLAWHAGRSKGSAGRLVRLGTFLQRFEATAKALDAGDISVDHATSLAFAVTDERAEIYERDETMLLDDARRFDHRNFMKLLRAWKYLADDALDTDDEARNHEKRSLSIAALLNGLAAGAITLEPEGLAILKNAIEAYRVTDDDDMPGPRRTRTQVLYDALIAALAASINGGVPGVPQRTTDIIVGQDVLNGDAPTEMTLARSEIVGVGPVPPGLLRRLAADSAVGRIIATAAGLPLDVGMQIRFFTRAQKRAIRFRDDTCIWPGCHLPGNWCDVDHAIEASKGGPTNLDLGRFLCHRHHHLRHKGWQVDYDPHRRTTTITSPLGITYHDGPDPPPG